MPGPGPVLGTSGWHALAILCVVTLLSQLDRQLTTIIVNPLKTEFHLSDTQIGLLHGYAFAITYAIFGIPFGWLADHGNRRNMIMLGLLAWSTLTLLSGFASNYNQLLLLRSGVGIGEAILAPAAYSLLIDFFEPAKRGRAISIYYMAMSIGSGASLFVGGILLNLLPSAGLNLTGALSLEPWRLLFVFAGLPGMFACLLLLTIREPNRRGSIPGEKSTIAAFLSYIWMHKRTLGPISLAGTLISTAGYGAAAWMPTLLERRFSLPPSSTAESIGIAMVMGSIIGTLLSGSLSDRLLRRAEPGARTRPMLLGYICLLPSIFLGLASEAQLSVFLFGVVLFGVGMVQSALPLALQESLPANMRGQVMAVQYLIQGLCSIGLGPTFVGVITDSVFGSTHMLGWSLFVLLMPTVVIGIVICYFGLNKGQQYRIEPRAE